MPAIWDEQAKQAMRGAYNEANLGSAHPLKLVLEPEAASIYCFSRFKEPTFGGKNTMIVDCGGGTVDLIVHANDASDGSVKLRELSKGSGDLCGGTFVDDAFLDAMARRIPGFDAYRQAEPAELLRGLMAKWELLKRSFDGTTDAILACRPSWRARWTRPRRRRAATTRRTTRTPTDDSHSPPRTCAASSSPCSSRSCP